MTLRTSSALFVALPLLVGARFLFVGHPSHSTDAIFAGLLSLMAILFYRPNSKTRLFYTALVVAVLSLCASTFFSVQPLMSLLSLSGIVAFAAALAIGHYGGPLVHQRIRWGLLVGACLHSVTALYQVIWSWPALLAQSDALGLSPSIINRLEIGRPLGLSLSPDLGGAVAMSGVFMAGSLLAAHWPKIKTQGLSSAGPFPFALVSALVLCSVALFLSKSAGVYLALAIGLAALAFLALKRWALRVLALTSALSAALLFVYVGRGFSRLTTSAHERLLNWEAATDMGQSLFGVGLFRFAPVYLAERSAEMNVTRYAHSALFQGFAESGILGLVAITLVGTVVARSLFRRRKTLDLWTFGLFGALLLRSLYDYDLQIAQNLTLFGWVTGLLFGSERDAHDDTPLSNRRMTLLLLPILSFGVLTVVLQTREAIVDGATSNNFTARYLKTLPSDDRVAVLFTRQASRCSSDCASLHAQADALAKTRLAKPYPPVPVALYAAARLVGEGQHEAARRAYEIALKANPHDPPLRAFVQSQLRALSP